MTPDVNAIVLDQVPCGVVVFDDDGRVVHANQTLAGWLGIPPADLEGEQLEALLPAGGKIFLRTHFFPLLHGGQDVQEVYFALRGGDGKDIPVLLNASRVVTAAGTRNVAAFMAISSRHQFEDTLLRALRSEQEAREVLEAQNAELTRIESRLNRAGAVKDEFLGLVSHELRSPLAMVSGAVSLLRRRFHELDEPTRDELLADVAAQCARLLSLVEDMLIVARADLGHTVDLEPVLLQRIIPALLRRMDGGIAESRLAMDPDLPPVYANAGFVEQIITNFLTNATKYGADGAPIEIAVQPASGAECIEITVGNAGDTLDANQVERFFEPFFREERSPGKLGLGLGLSVCKRLAEAQGGEVRARPRASGGLEITLSLPVLAGEA